MNRTYETSVSDYYRSSYLEPKESNVCFVASYLLLFNMIHLRSKWYRYNHVEINCTSSCPLTGCNFFDAAIFKHSPGLNNV